MRVLWLSGNPALYKRKSMIDGGWIGTLQGEIVKRGLNLAIAFPYGKDDAPSDGDGVRYYPLYVSRLMRKINRFTQKRVDHIYIHKVLHIVDEFKPDIIHCWGSELCFGLIAKYINIPMVMHIQGIINPIVQAFLPANMSGLSVLKGVNFNPVIFYRKYLGPYLSMSYQAKRELDILRHVHNYFGRTDWDRNVTMLLSPSARYHYCSEALRPPITSAEKWSWHGGCRDRIVIATTISAPIYKGADVILKTAKLLKDSGMDNVEWNIYGVSEIKMQERFTCIKTPDVGVHCRGKVDAKVLADCLRESDVYVHPSYIDNSPNSVCEAQYIGVPVIAANVGGVPTLLADGAGVLVPSNDAYQTAYFIRKICAEQAFAEQLSNKEMEISKGRHDVSSIIESIMDVYVKMMNNESK